MTINTHTKINISAVLITLNNEAVIASTLAALQWCEEILVVDSGSTDRTLAIAEQYGCRILHRDFDGYGTQKNFAVNQATHNWVFSIDADEVVSDELRQEIAQIFNKPIDFQGFYVPISLVFLGKLLRFGGEYKMLHLRLFNRQFGNFNLKIVHEGVELPGKIGTLQNQVLHDSYASIEAYFDKFNRYTTQGAELLLNRGKGRSQWQVFLRLPLTFLKIYVLKLGFLDGYPGFVWAIFSAMYPVVKYAKLNEKLSRLNA